MQSRSLVIQMLCEIVFRSIRRLLLFFLSPFVVIVLLIAKTSLFISNDGYLLLLALRTAMAFSLCMCV